MLALVSAAGLLAGLAGCGSELGATVAGTVTLDGQPVGPGMVNFMPAEEMRNPADGAIQIDGSYSLRTINTEGLHPGRYRVSVVVLQQPEVKPGERSYADPKQITPAKYADPTTSGLEFTVEPGANAIDLPLRSE